jgi:hypothetical protein
MKLAESRVLGGLQLNRQENCGIESVDEKLCGWMWSGVSWL